jgi:hypothetical protein
MTRTGPADEAGPHAARPTLETDGSIPRPVAEIRDEVVRLAADAYEAGKVVDPNRLEQLARELDEAAALATMWGGDATATETFAREVEHCAELARVLARKAGA